LLKFVAESFPVLKEGQELAFVRDALRMLLERLAMAVARQSMAWSTGSKVAWIQWVVQSWCKFACCISGFGRMLGAHVWGKGGSEHVIVIIDIIGELPLALVVAAAFSWQHVAVGSASQVLCRGCCCVWRLGVLVRALPVTALGSHCHHHVWCCYWHHYQQWVELVDMM